MPTPENPAAPLIIEARLNEYTMRNANPHVPWTPSEIAADAEACRRAGAAVVHYHPRSPDGSVDLSYQTSEAIVRNIRARTDVLIHPTLGAMMQVQDPHQRLSTIIELTHNGYRPDFAPIDVGTSNADLLAPDMTRFATTDVVYLNATSSLQVFADTLRRLGIKPYLHVWNLVQLRVAAVLHRLGYLDGPLWAGLCLSGDDAPIHHPPTPGGIAAYVDNIPEGLPIILSVNGFHCDVLDLAPAIIASGGHLAIGLGDHHYANRGQPNNAELVVEVARIAQRMGRPIASPADTVAILGIDEPARRQAQ